ncbi:hypothetical protein [Salimicrobium halophilum]|uniref:Uncharacterized protein n=1 Tax=Salimicrobium halophilum TaxID=86666 RepID=A0A1G8SCE8_9BACI|nr:hypothetical protein [Salimicrobium halophilum]SDJ26405.1 hypothetical protein SAMN04490247_1355 [Salimicrobium halophilum]
MTAVAEVLMGLSAVLIIFGLGWMVVMLVMKKSVQKAIQTTGAGLTILVIGGLLSIPGVRQAEVDGNVVVYEDLMTMIEEQEGILEGIETDVAAAEKKKRDKDTEIAGKEEEITALDKEIKAKQAEVDEINAMIDGKKELENEISDIDGQLDAKKKEMEDLDGQLAVKKEELADMDTSIKEKKMAPVQLPAGHFTIGKDLPPNRYKVMPLGRGSNFIVYSSSGSLLVNTILDRNGESGFGVPEYIFEATDGGTIESEESVKLIPVE